MPLAAPIFFARRPGQTSWLSLSSSSVGSAVRRRSSPPPSPSLVSVSAAVMLVNCGTALGSLCCQRRGQSALHKLLQDPSDPYLRPIQDLDMPQIAAIAKNGKKEAQHLLDGLTAITVSLSVQLGGNGVTEEDIDAAFSVYTEVLRHAPGTAGAAGIGDDAGSVSEDVWRMEWERPLEEFRVVFRLTGDTRLS
ncbi:hypothetical protein C3747_23g122 [Trypanosoma cruzi]|uniref:Uncharacterized protein n=2 Tax=Trypanosoma cruzi TaxID=5693 RepID=Q4E1K3_TRYCC|nr:hypothetical protein, conserved [Trypanosoma cruzi]EAN98668.1 hypothetical protein, conserved [Trypanosoma cruzi]PWV16464.1 hypothetical protein C3747_23g122 [Trypanosoma cruzi]RNC47693.1 hypothetical protein TcCL_NonESM02463 [Trypanosoma cruzi]|eukprot:XP_820519.1 hypothetical protein [Trypanosoma cruzi strain CL Brener]